MSIIYALISREDTQDGYGENIHVLVETSTDASGNFPQVTRELILKQVPRNQKSIYNYKEKYVYHTLNEDSFTYLCLTDAGYPKRAAQSFLEEIKQRFTEEFPFEKRIRAITFSMNDSFGKILMQRMSYYNENSLDPKMARIRTDAHATLGVMEQNLESIMERGDRIELLVKKANALNVESSGLQSRSTALKEKERRKILIRNLIILAVIVAIIVFFFVL